MVRAALLSLVGLTAAAGAEAGARIQGQVTLDLPGTTLASLGPIVVFLEPIDGEARPARSAAPERVVQINASFSPSFLVVPVGQTVDMPNADLIYHNVFSYSRPNDFDLGIYPAGESRSIRFEHPGVVKVYCSIHESMNATIVVTPTPSFDVVEGTGRFSIEGVPPGRYRLRTWCEKLPETSREIDVGSGASLSLSLDLTPATG